jgi:hypothetical protein
VKNPIHSVTVFVRKDTPIGTAALMHEDGTDTIEILQIGSDGALTIHLKDDARERIIEALLQEGK